MTALSTNPAAFNISLCIIGLLGVEDDPPLTVLHQDNDQLSCITHNRIPRCLTKSFLLNNADVCSDEAERVGRYLESRAITTTTTTAVPILAEEEGVGDLSLFLSLQEELRQCYENGNDTAKTLDDAQGTLETFETMHRADFDVLNKSLGKCLKEKQNKETIITNLVGDGQEAKRQRDNCRYSLQVSEDECNQRMRNDENRYLRYEARVNDSWSQALTNERDNCKGKKEKLQHEVDKLNSDLTRERSDCSSEASRLRMELQKASGQMRLQAETDAKTLGRCQSEVQFKDLDLIHVRGSLQECEERLGNLTTSANITTPTTTTTQATSTAEYVTQPTPLKLTQTEEEKDDTFEQSTTSTTVSPATTTTTVKSTSAAVTTTTNALESQDQEADRVLPETNDKDRCNAAVYKIMTVPWYCLVMGSQSALIVLTSLCLAIRAIAKKM